MTNRNIPVYAIRLHEGEEKGYNHTIIKTQVMTIRTFRITRKVLFIEKNSDEM